MDRDVRHHPVPRQGAAENDGLKLFFIPMFQHGQEVVPCSSAKIVRENHNIYQLIRVNWLSYDQSTDYWSSGRHMFLHHYFHGLGQFDRLYIRRLRKFQEFFDSPEQFRFLFLCIGKMGQSVPQRRRMEKHIQYLISLFHHRCRQPDHPFRIGRLRRKPYLVQKIQSVQYSPQPEMLQLSAGYLFIYRITEFEIVLEKTDRGGNFQYECARIFIGIHM